MQVDTLSFGGAFKRILEKENKNKTQAAQIIGKSDAYIHKFINDGSSPKINTAIDVLGPFGYTLAVVPKESDLPEGSAFLRKVDIGNGRS